MRSISETSVLIVDDHTLLRETIRHVLLAEGGFRVVGEACDGNSAVALAARTEPDIVLLDIGMPRNDPMTTVRRLREVSAGSRLIILSMYDDPHLITTMMRSGVHGYLHKSVSRHDLVAVIRSTRAEDELVTISVSRENAARVGSGSTGILSNREKEVLSLVGRALSNRQIASRLDITEGTVKRHLRNIFDKLGAVSRIDAVNKAVSASLIQSRHGQDFTV